MKKINPFQIENHLTDTKFNNLFIGTLGAGSKIITFPENEFKKELAPTNATIKHWEVDGEKKVTMTYKL